MGQASVLSLFLCVSVGVGDERVEDTLLKRPNPNRWISIRHVHPLPSAFIPPQISLPYTN